MIISLHQVPHVWIRAVELLLVRFDAVYVHRTGTIFEVHPARARVVVSERYHDPTRQMFRFELGIGGTGIGILGVFVVDLYSYDECTFSLASLFDIER